MKGQFDFHIALKVAEKAREILTPFCSVIVVCGSIRRRRPIVGDVDIVCVLKEDARLWGFKQCLVGYGGSNGANTNFQITLDGISVDIWRVPLEPLSFAMAFATGPMEENVRLRSIAKRKGWKLNQYGLFDSSTGTATRVQLVHRGIGGFEDTDYGEVALYHTLGEPYIPPQVRDVSSGATSTEQNHTLLITTQAQVD